MGEEKYGFVGKLFYMLLWLCYFLFCSKDVFVIWMNIGYYLVWLKDLKREWILISKRIKIIV